MSDLITKYVEHMEYVGCTQATVDFRCRILRKADRELPDGLAKATTDQLMAWMAPQQKRWTKWTYDATFRSFYKALVEDGHLPKDPTKGLPRTKAGDIMPHPISDDDLDTALRLAPDGPYRSGVVLAAYAGLRVMEFCDLEREDVTKEALHVRNGKGGKGRWVPTHPMIWDLVRRMPDGKIVRSRVGEDIKPASIASNQRVFWRSMGIGDHVSFHDLRAWFATTMVNLGHGIEVVSQLLGHATVATTQIYLKVAIARHMAAVASLPTRGLQPVSTRLEPLRAVAA